MLKLALSVVVIFAILGGVYWIFKTNNSSATPTQFVSNVVMDEKDTGANGSYIQYSQSAFQRGADKKRVLFFHAAWCPTCKVANEEFTSRVNDIPDGVIIFKTDYDTETELKKKYNITYQHTFVLVDESGTEVKKWNGGGLAELISNTN